jgi:superfamily II DNA or RNA helicase
MILRDRQIKLKDKCISALTDKEATIAVAPTGFGKTIVLSAIIGELIARNPSWKVCVLAHRDELTAQNESKFTLVNPDISTSIVDSRNKSWDGQVTFAMVQTLSRENNLEQMSEIDLLVIDEAHHVVTITYQSIINRARELNPNVKILGLTATPARGDKKGLGKTFKHCADIVYLTELITSGHLVTPHTHIIDLNVKEQFEALKTRNNGEYDDEEVAAIMDKKPINEAVVKHWYERARDRKTVVFCSTIAHARNVANTFNDYGILAALITGEMSREQRSIVFENMNQGTIQVIVNVAVLTEGWDYPPISCVVLLRSCSQKSTMIQMVGRGLRIVDNREYPGIVKKDCIVLDFGISCILHKSLITDVNLEESEATASSNSEKQYKECPKCESENPISAEECVFCGYVFEMDTAEKTPIKNFKMREIDMLTNKSHFAWEEVRNELFTCGFNSWSAIRPKGDNFIVIGGGLKEDAGIVTSILYEGDKLTAIAKANDFLSENETVSYAKKNAGWRKEKPSEKQIELLAKLSKFSKLNPQTLTRGQVATIFAYEFNARKQMNQLRDLIE